VSDTINTRQTEVENVRVKIDVKQYYCFILFSLLITSGDHQIFFILAYVILYTFTVILLHIRYTVEVILF